ncbi:MAG TPA: serine/threonine-protein kinase [Kofleriaceae bacterium]|jgi:serine/threonine-protein kinase
MTLGSLGKYRLDHRLGGGGMAEVFIGSTMGAEGFSRKVAIKRVLPGFSDNPQFAQMFVAEAQITARIVHPNIVSVLDFDRDAENRLFLVMELVEGRDLDGLLTTGPLPVPVVAFVIGEVLRGLGYAHDLPTGEVMRGIVHRDISPHNVLLSWEGAVKVSDFGIAKARAASEATASVFIKGKPAYMSPEQANGQALDGRSDLFAVGIMLWEMLVGRRLFVGDDVRTTLAAVLFGQIPRPRSLRGDVPKDIERVAMKLLERDLAARYPSAEAALEDLLACMPRNGRELLATTLMERFPHDAPVRQNRPRSHATPQAVPLASTITGPEHTPVGAHSLGGAMTAPTMTLGGKRPMGNGAKAAIGGAIVLATAVIAFSIVSTLRRGTGSSAVAGVTPHTDAPVADVAPPAPPPPPPDALTVAPPDAAPAPPPPPDAPVSHHGGSHPPLHTPQPPPDAGPSAPPPPVEPTGEGTLDVTSDTGVSVRLDGRDIGDTPVRGYKVAAGSHRVLMINADAAIHDERAIMIEPNKNTKIKR